MKNIKSIALAASVIAALGLSTAFAASQDADTNPHKMRDKVLAAQQAKKNDQRPLGFNNLPRNRRPHQNHSLKTLSELTGKDEQTIREECRTKKINPMQYAAQQGVYDQFKAKRLAFAKERLDKAVKDGKITQAKADEFMQRFDKRLDDAKDGKLVQRRHKGPRRMEPKRNADGTIAQGSEGMAYREREDRRLNPRFSPMHPGPVIPQQ